MGEEREEKGKDGGGESKKDIMLVVTCINELETLKLKLTQD